MEFPRQWNQGAIVYGIISITYTLHNICKSCQGLPGYLIRGGHSTGM